MPHSKHVAVHIPQATATHCNTRDGRSISHSEAGMRVPRRQEFKNSAARITGSLLYPGLRHGHLHLRARSELLGHRLRGQPQGLHYLGLNDDWYPEVYVSLGYPAVDAYASASVDIYGESHVHQEKI